MKIKCPNCKTNSLSIKQLAVETGERKEKLIKTVAKCKCGFERYPVPERWKNLTIS